MHLYLQLHRSWNNIHVDRQLSIDKQMDRQTYLYLRICGSRYTDRCTYNYGSMELEKQMDGQMYLDLQTHRS